jgi:hypothetical protein
VRAKVLSNIGGVEVVSLAHGSTIAMEVVTIKGTTRRLPKLVVSGVLSDLSFYRNWSNITNI